MKKRSLLDELAESPWIEDFLWAVIKACGILIVTPFVVLVIIGLILELVK